MRITTSRELKKKALPIAYQKKNPKTYYNYKMLQ